MLKLFKRIVFSAFIIYSFNIIAVKFNIVIPINLFTIGFVSILDIPGMTMLVLAFAMIFN